MRPTEYPPRRGHPRFRHRTDWPRDDDPEVGHRPSRFGGALRRASRTSRSRWPSGPRSMPLTPGGWPGPSRPSPGRRRSPSTCGGAGPPRCLACLDSAALRGARADRRGVRAARRPRPRLQLAGHRHVQPAHRARLVRARGVLSVPLALASPAAYLIGVERMPGTGSRMMVAAAVLLIMVASVHIYGRRALYRRAAAADAALAEADRAAREQYVILSRNVERREHERLLHDTVLNTLTALARVGPDDRDDVAGVVSRCRQDVALIEAALSDPDPDGRPPGTATWSSGVRGVAAEMTRPRPRRPRRGGRRRARRPGPGRHGAVERHPRGAVERGRARRDRRRLGRGQPHRAGARPGGAGRPGRSAGDRAGPGDRVRPGPRRPGPAGPAEVHCRTGGRLRWPGLVWSAPGRGTVVRMSWPARCPGDEQPWPRPARPQPTAASAGESAAVVSHHEVVRDTTESGLARLIDAMAVIMPAAGLIQTLANLGDYRQPAVAVAVWAALLGGRGLAAAAGAPGRPGPGPGGGGGRDRGGRGDGDRVGAPPAPRLGRRRPRGPGHGLAAGPGRAEPAGLDLDRRRRWPSSPFTPSWSSRSPGPGAASLAQLEAGGYILATILIAFAALRPTLAMHTRISARRASLASRSDRRTRRGGRRPGGPADAGSPGSSTRRSRCCAASPRAGSTRPTPACGSGAPGTRPPCGIPSPAGRRRPAASWPCSDPRCGPRERAGLLVNVQVIGDPGVPPPDVARAVLATVDAALGALPPHQVMLTVLAPGEEAELYLTFSERGAG